MSSNGEAAYQLLGHRFVAPALAPGLYVVSTPIGNLKDISVRALETLAAADLILCEDTRHSARLLDHFGISGERLALHEHNERARMGGLIERLERGQTLALISDAGTPLLSDPGFPLVRAAREKGLPVFAVPGASALLSALTISGLPTDRFGFFGFPPVKLQQRRAFAEEQKFRSETLVFYEAPRRLGATMAIFAEIFGAGRRALVGFELTKKFERVRAGDLASLAIVFDKATERGEAVIVVAGAPEKNIDQLDWEAALAAALAEMPLSRAVREISLGFGIARREVYETALALRRP